MEPKYHALRFIAGLYFILGALVLIIGSLAAFSTAAFSPPAFAYGMTANGGTSSINLLVGGVMEVGVLVVGIALIGVSQLVQLLLRLAEETRTTNENQIEQLRLMRMLVNQGGQR
ncbi:MAG: hypothetical protein H0X30_11375 [Anaerolineae bacterium]|nr:hypothetical protein [Anaerolineae bacterium]